MNKLSVSKKFYSDISKRISSALSACEGSEVEAMRIVDAYLDGEVLTSDDGMAVLAFNMIRVELDRAMTRSKRARERAEKRKMAQKSANAPAQKTVAEMMAELMAIHSAACGHDSEDDEVEELRLHQHVVNAGLWNAL